MKHFGNRIIILLFAVLFLVDTIPVFAVANDKLAITITAVDNSTSGKLTTAHDQKISIAFTAIAGYTKITALKFDNGQPMESVGDAIKFEADSTTSTEYTADIPIRLKRNRESFAKGTITLEGSPEKTFDFTLDLSGKLPDSGANPNTYNLQSYRFYDKDGDLIPELTKGKKIEKLVVTLKDGGFSKETYDSASKGDFNASLNYDTFELKDNDELPRFSSEARDLPDGCVSYTVTFYDLRYTGKTRDLTVKIGYPAAFGLERREFTETIPEGEIHENNSSSSSSDESSSEVEIDPPTPRILVTNYDYGGANVAAASEATLTLTFKNVSKRVPVDNVVLKVTMPEAFTMTNSSNLFYFERIGREREQTVTIKFSVKPTAEAISQVIKLNFAYETVVADKRTPLTSDEDIAIPVTQINRVMLNTVESPPEVYIGDANNTLESTFINKGKTPVYNVTASIEGTNLKQVGQSQFIGNIESGVEKSAEFALEGLEAGPIKGEIVLTYEDANMKISELRTPFSTEAKEMDMGPSPEELAAMNQPQDEPVQATAWYEAIPSWYWAVGGMLLILAIAYLIKLTRVSRLTLLEDDDEDF